MRQNDSSDLSPDARYRVIRKASVLGIVGNSFLALLKIITGFITGSYALLGAGVDTATDIATSIITLVAAGITAKPPDHAHPYGHSRAETLATKILAIFIFFAGIQLALASGKAIFSGEERHIMGLPAIIVALVSMLGKGFLAFGKYRAGKRVSSSMLIADAKNMRNDIFISAAAFLGIGLTYIFDMPVLDSITALGVSLFIIKVGFDVFRETDLELMEGIEDPALYNRIFSIVAGVEGAKNPHRTRIRKLNTQLVIDMDIEVDPSISVFQGHEISKNVEKKLRNEIENVYDIIVHIEPEGNIEYSEKYGLSEDSFRQDTDRGKTHG